MYVKSLTLLWDLYIEKKFLASTSPTSLQVLHPAHKDQFKTICSVCFSMKLRYNNGEKEHIKGHGSGEFPYRFPNILLYFHLTPHSYLQLITCYSVTFAVKTSPTFANLPNTTLSITAPFVILKSVEWYTLWNVVVKVWPALSLAASKNIPPEQHLNTMWTMNMVTTVLLHLWTKERRGPVVTVRGIVWRSWRVSEVKMIVYSKVCLWFYPFSNLTTHFYRNQKSQTFRYH